VEARRKADRPRTCRRRAQCRQQLARLPAACFQSTSCPLHSLPSTGKLAKSADFHTIYCYFRYNKTITWHTANILTLTFWSVSGTFVIQRQQEKEEITDCMYKIPCVSCEKCYIGETGRKFDTRLKEHKTEVETITSKPFARNQRASKSV